MSRLALAFLFPAVLASLASGCAHYTTTATVDIAGPEGAKLPPSKVKPAEVQLWPGSAPAGVEVHGDTLTVKPESGWELVGRAQVVGTYEPSVVIVFPAVACGLLSIVGAPCAFTYWIYYIASIWLEAPDPRKDEQDKRALHDKLKEMAAKSGAHAIVFVDFPQSDGAVDTMWGGQPVFARGYLLRARGGPPPPVAPSGTPPPSPISTAY